MTGLPRFPEAIEDGGAGHLTPGLTLPSIALPATDGGMFALAASQGRSVLIVYPWTGRPGHPNPPDWDFIPGAHGSTPELEGFRDRHDDFTRARRAALRPKPSGHGISPRAGRAPCSAIPDSERRRRGVRRRTRSPHLPRGRRDLPQAHHASDRRRLHRDGLLSNPRSGRSRRGSVARTSETAAR